MILTRKRKLTPGRALLCAVTFRWLFFGLIWLYKHTLSHLIGGSCIYHPTCSTYMYQAIDEWGTVRGIALGAARVVRCNPFSAGGTDRVPFNPGGDVKWLR